MQELRTTSTWGTLPSNFTPAPELGRPPGGSYPVIHFFEIRKLGARWIGKCGQVPLQDKEVLEALSEKNQC